MTRAGSASRSRPDGNHFKPRLLRFVVDHLGREPRGEDLTTNLVLETADDIGRPLPCAIAFHAVLEYVDEQRRQFQGNLVLVGVSPVGSPLPVDLYDLHYREITVGGAFGAGDAFAEALGTLPRLNLKGVVSGRYPLEEITQAFAASAGGEGVKYMIAPHD